MSLRSLLVASTAMPPDDSSPSRGLLIAFEGGDGSGKSTQAERLAERIGAKFTREPGGTAVGDKIRELVLDPEHPELADRTEALLMAAARAQHVDELIAPCLESGRHVVTDRYVASSLAYQGVGRGLGIETIATLNQFATHGVMPDLTVFLDVDVDAARNRLGEHLDRIEDAGAGLGERVVETYRLLAAQDPEGWIVVDANGSIEDVAARIDAAISERFVL